MTDHTCTIAGCDRPMKRRTWCGAHYAKWRKYGDPLTVVRVRRKCFAWGCERSPESYSLCRMHLRRLAKGGALTERTLLDIFFEHVSEDAPGCWVWDKPNATTGYGQFGGTTSHRWLYRQLVADLPGSLDLDHLCRNRACVNPDHLDPVPETVNILRGTSPPALNARKTHCKRGHEFTLDNTRITTRGARLCRACHREAQRAKAAA